MNQEKILAAAQIIKDTTVVFLAEKHGVSISAILHILRSDAHHKVKEQFDELVHDGIAETIRLHLEQQISLT